MSSIAPISTQLPFASTKIYPLPSIDRKLGILSSVDIQTRTLITNKLQGTNNMTKKNTLSTSPSLISTLSAMSRKLLHNAMNVIDPPFHSSADSSPVFSENFAPVMDELEPTDCQVTMGELPPNLNGAYIRNGPNLQHQPRHFLDFFFGDGMLHCLQLSDGQARYCCRYVQTYKYKLERDAGSPIVPSGSSLYRIIDMLRFLKAIVTGHFDLTKGFGVANTSLAFFANKLVALCEYDLPYVINMTENGDIETLGRWELDGNNPKLLASMTAHPKVDSDTKETFAFRWSLIFPHLTFFRFDENGVKQKEVPIFSIKQLSFFHDFAITNRFAIYHETQLVVAPMKAMMERRRLVDHNLNKAPRIGIIPRNALDDSEMKWFEIPEFNTIHILNAYEEGDEEIVLVASNIVSLESIFDETVELRLEKVTINTKTKKISRNILSPRNLEFGCINPCYVGKKNRFAYLGVNNRAGMKMSGVIKIDLEMGCEVGRRIYELGCCGGEPLFVQRDSEDILADEDDGFLMTYLHDEQTNESKFLVMDAKSSELDVVAMVRLPRRVPYGFHGLFLRKDQIPSYKRT